MVSHLITLTEYFSKTNIFHMKQSLLLLFFSAVVISVKAQLSNTNWKGTIQGDQTIEVVFHFNNDTLKVENMDDASTIEVLTYAAKDSLITFQKLYGQSECGTDAIGQYKYVINKNEITFTLVEDACEQRSAVLNNSKWTKVQ
jgi:hypothetical protein